jgi:ArsR family metal-binding transcriptional regulator
MQENARITNLDQAEANEIAKNIQRQVNEIWAECVAMDTTKTKSRVSTIESRLDSFANIEHVQ